MDTSIPLPQQVPERVRVLFIGGYGRSGSTLMLRLLGELPGVVPVGELIDIWDRSFRQNQLCGCGESFHDCPFWQKVSQEVFGVLPNEVPAAELDALRLRVHGRRPLPQLMLFLPFLRSRAYKRDLEQYVALLGRLISAIQSVSGAKVVVDSSKLPQFARLLAVAKSVELNVLHLVRDGRAVAHSWRRTKVRPEIHWQVAEMERQSLVRSAVEWDWCNGVLSAGKDSTDSYTLIRYEDFVAKPHAAIQALVEQLDLNVTDQIDGSQLEPEVNLHASHTVAGNPSRFEKGAVRVSRDDEWLSAMTPREKTLVTALTAPWLKKYHYPLSVVGNRWRKSL